MNLSETVSNIIARHSQELYLFLQFVRDCDTYIHHRRTRVISDMDAAIPNNIKTEFRQFAGEFTEFLGEVLSESTEPTSTKGKGPWEFKPRKKYPEEITKYLFPFLTVILKPISYPQFLYDMAVTHTIAIFESFLSDFLTAIFKLRPNTLKSENTATYKDILSFSSRKKLIGHLASNKAEKILDGDLYCDVADKLNKTFSIAISKFDKFNTIHESFCRRHIIVHNGGVIDKEYCKKIPNSQIGKEISTDLQYIETLLTTMGQFIDYLDDRFSRKMRYKRNPFVNQLLNPPDSVRESKDSS